MIKNYMTLDLDETLSKLGDHVNRTSRMNLYGFTPKNATLRLVVFKTKGTSCCYCGREATHFQLEENFKSGQPETLRQNPHLNMYSGEMLMTKEHIVPKSEGGRDHIDNLLTCCYECNNLRSDLNLPSIEKIKGV